VTSNLIPFPTSPRSLSWRTAAAVTGLVSPSPHTAPPVWRGEGGHKTDTRPWLDDDIPDHTTPPTPQELEACAVYLRTRHLPGSATAFLEACGNSISRAGTAWLTHDLKEI
jgi:hypothetical protein